MVGFFFVWRFCFALVVVSDDGLRPNPTYNGGMRILIIEDNPDILANLYAYLEPKGHVLDSAMNGYAGLALLAQHEYDVIVLDVMLPGLTGLELCQKLRSELRNSTPVLMLTARDTLQDKVAGFDSGADDYLVKPFSFAELLARVRTILRRGRNGTEVTLLQVADLELDLLRRRVIRSGKRIDLTAKEFGLLELLMRRQGEVLPRSLIASQVWDMNFDSDSNVIEVAMRRLRAKVDDAYEVKLIQTVRGMGYVLEAPEESA